MKEHKKFFGLSSCGIVILLGAIIKFVMHLYYAPEYGFFGDELYTIALSRHLAFGYVDLPPLVPALAALSRVLFGESLFAYHIFPALAGASTLVFVGLITKEFGGKTFAVLLSVLAFTAVPIALAFNSIFCYDGFDQLVLAVFLYVLVRFIRSGNRWLWLLLGLVAGIACLTKMTILFFGPSFLVALLISKYRKILLSPWPWLGAVICAVVVLPYLVWQAANGWPTLEYWNNYSAFRMAERPSILEFLIDIFYTAGLLLVPLWLAGLFRTFRRLDEVDYSFLALMFIGTGGTLFILNTQSRMLAGLFMPLLASGAVFVEELFIRISLGKWIRVTAIGYLLLAGVSAVLTELPILSLERVEAVSSVLGPLHPPYQEFGETFYVSSMFSGKLGWEKFVQDVAQVYAELPPEERVAAGIWADWYAPASAIDYYGPQYGLPHAVSGHLTYYLWGPGYSWNVMIVITQYPITSFFYKCNLRKTIHHPYVYVGSPEVYICRYLKTSIDELWPQLKAYR